jgi:hypothetical protein
MIIGLTGVSDSGKGWVSAHLSQRYGFAALRIGDPVSRMIEAGFGLSGEGSANRGQTVPWLGGLTIRQLKRSLGADWGRRQVSTDVWVKMWERALPQAGQRVVTDDLRFPNEIAALRAAGGLVWHVERPGYGPDETSESRAARDMPCDGWLVNDTSIAALLRRVDVKVTTLFAEMKEAIP